MKLNNEYNWTDRFRKGVGGMVLGAALLLSASTVEAANGISVSFLGCKGASNNGYVGKMIPDIHTEHEDFMMYFCNQDAFTHGELGKWGELDMVPFHLIVHNKTDIPQDFTFKAGGQFSPHGINPGWDYITEFTLDAEATSAVKGGNVEECKKHGAETSQSLIYEDGNIYRQVIIKDFPAGLTCVPHFNMRLAMGSGINPGASLHGLLKVSGDEAQPGTKSLPVKVLPTVTFSKTMNAISTDTENTWTVEKEATPATINFGDTCAEEASLEGDVQITVSWKKISTGADGKVTVTTVITASNTAKRDIGISVVDKLYGIDEINPLATENCQKMLTANSTETVCTNIFKIDPVDAKNLHDVAVATYSDPDHNAPILHTKETTASTDDPSIGSGVNDSATIKEHEWITGDDLSYKVVSVSGANGQFTNYAEGEVTTEHIDWTSDSQSNSGSVVFNKKVYVAKATIGDGSLNDRATIQGSDSGGIEDESTATVNLTSTRLLKVTLTKEITEPRDTATDFSFDVLNPNGYDRTVTLTIPAGQTSASEIYTDIDAVRYNVKEVAQAGWQAVGDATKIVDLTGGVCTGEAAFKNERADQFINVKVRKLTFPEKIGSEDQSAGWAMTLSREVSAGIWEVVSTENTIGAGAWVTLADETTLTAGNYKIEETMKDGWHNIGKDSDCTFTYDGNPERQDFECIYANEKEGTIIIRKEIVGDIDTKFGFTQNIDDTALELSGGESKSYENLRSGTYSVTENDPGEGISLSALTCIDPSSNTYTDRHFRAATIQLAPGETVECTFRNVELKNEPSIIMEKLTNGEDADETPGPRVKVGDTITWEYIVTNNGNVHVDNIVVTDDKVGVIPCPSSALEIGESMICTASGIATKGQYENVGTVTSREANASDLSHYLGVDSAVDPEEGENCPCNDVKSDSSSTFGTVSAILMMLMTLMAGLFFVRREELLNKNVK